MVEEGRGPRGSWPSVTVVGLGGLGSWTALALAKCGFVVLEVYDPDKVEEKNTQNQVYSITHVGQYKVRVMEGLLHPFSSAYHGYTNKVTRYSQFENPIIVAAVDSLESRQEILAACEASPAVKVLLDLRAGGGTLKLLTCNPRSKVSVKEYTATLVAAPEAMAVCLEAFEAHIGMIAAGLAVRTLQELLMKGGVEKLIALHVPDLHLLQDGPHPWPST